MGQFQVRVTFVHPVDRQRRSEIELLVDTGATLSWVPREVLEPLSLPRLRRRSFQMADGRIVERDTVGAIVELNGEQTFAEIVIADAGDSCLLGATTLESLGFAVDPIRRRLVPQPLLAMSTMGKRLLRRGGSFP